MRRINSLFPTTLLQKPAAAARAAVTGALGLLLSAPLLAGPALAQSASGEIAGEPAVETPATHEGGLPQLTQTDTFASQIFWTIVTFGVLYFVVARIILPRLAGTMEERQDKIDDDLSRADKLKGEADQVMADYEQGLQQARSEASDLLRQAQDAWQAEAAERNAVEDRKLAEKIKADEARIAKARAEAEGNLKSVAGSVAAALTEKLIGVTPPDPQVEKAVDVAVQR